jgi:regulator of RNase E activity RraA
MSASSLPRDDLSLLSRLERLDASTVSDANKSLRVLPAAIRPVSARSRLLGRAVTANARDDQLTEDALCSSIADGVSLFDKLNFDEHVKNLRAGQASSLSFNE